MLQFFSIFTLKIILSFKYNIITFSPIFFYDLILILNGVDFICSLGIILLLVPLYKYFQPTNADAQDVTNLKNRSIILLTGFLILPIGIFFLLSQIFFTFSDYRTIINIMIILLSIFFVLALITSVLYKYFHKNFFSSYTNKRLLKIQTLFKIGLLEIPVAFLFLISYATYRNGDLASAINTFISFIGICFFLLIIISILQNISPNKKFYDITTNTYFAIQRNNNDLSKKMENYFIITVALVLFYQYFSTTSVLPYIGFPNNFFSAIPLYLLLYNKSIFVSLVLLIFGLGLFYYIYKSEDIKKNANFSISIKIIAIAFILLSINFINFYIAMNGIILLILGLMFCSSQKIEIIFDNYFFNNLPKFREILQQIAVAEDQHKKVELATSLYDQVRIQFVIETKTNFIPDKETIQKYIENCINNSSKFLVDK